MVRRGDKDGALARVGVWLVVRDPGLGRLRLASATVLSVGLALAIQAIAARAVGIPITSGLLGVVIAMMCATAVTDASVRAQVITTVLMPIPVVVAVVCGAVFSAFPLVGELVFVLVMVAAAYVRQFGPRASALGMASYMSYFFALFLHARLAQLPVLVLSVVVGVGCALLVRTLILPNRPEREVARLLTAVGARIATIISLSIEVLTTPTAHSGAGAGPRLRRPGAPAVTSAPPIGPVDDRRGWPRRLSDAVVDLADTTLLAEDRLETLISTEVALRVFDAQLVTERLVSVIARYRRDQQDMPGAPPVPERCPSVRFGAAWGEAGLPRDSHTGDRADVETIVAVLSAVQIVLDTATRTRQSMRAASTLLADQLRRTPASNPRIERVQIATLALSRAVLALLDIDATTALPTPARHPMSAPGGPDRAVAGVGSPPATAAGWLGSLTRRVEAGFSGQVRQPVQVGLASGCAILVGQLISPSRWYWAAITAFVIYTGTTSAGQTLGRAWQRVCGTVAGVFGGVLIAAVVGGHIVWSFIGIGVCIFLAFYWVRVSYALMSFWITTEVRLTKCTSWGSKYPTNWAGAHG